MSASTKRKPKPTSLSIVRDDPKTSGEGATASAYNLNDVMSDSTHLHHLVEVIADELMNFDLGTDLARNRALERVLSLVWIALDLASHIPQHVEKNYRAIRRLDAAPLT